MKPDMRSVDSLQREFRDWRLWLARGVVVASAAAAGLTVVAFTWLTEHALTLFFKGQMAVWWAPLLWTPACTAAIVWMTRRFAPGAAGSGIPQVIAALDSSVDPDKRNLLVSLRLTLVKMLLTSWGALAGLSLVSVQPSRLDDGTFFSCR
jgi:H+/Cl- antiporter ClcA